MGVGVGKLHLGTVQAPHTEERGIVWGILLEETGYCRKGKGAATEMLCEGNNIA